MAETLVELVARISADSAELKKALSDSEKAVDKSGSSIQSKVESIKKSINGISTAWAGVGAAIIGGMGLVAKSAMDAVESENLFDASLKGNAKTAREWSNQMSKALGLNAYELRKNTGTFYVMLQSMGMTNDEALKMSESMTMLAYDMASFYNLRAEEAFDKIKSGIVGMPRPLQDLGIVINETMIKTYALKTGLIEQGEEMTEQQKITARYGALMEATTTAQGDLARTMDSPTNKMRILGSAIDEVKIIIGENLLPAIGNMLNSFTGIIARIKDWVTANPQLVKAIMAGAVAVAVIIGAVMGLKVALILLGTTANLMFGGILILIGALVTGGVLLVMNWDKVAHFFADIWSNMKNAVLHAVDAILSYLQNLVGFIPFLNDKIQQARDNISNMIEAEKVKRGLADVDRALKDTIEIIEEHTESIDIDTEALEANAKALKEQKEAHEDLINQMAKTRREYEYERSEAGKLRITLRDVTFALFDMGFTTEQIAQKMEALGDRADDVNVVLDAFGLTAQQVNDILNQQKDTIDETTKSYIEQAEAISKVITQQQKMKGTTGAEAAGHGIIEAGMSPEQIAYAKGYNWESITPSQYGQVVGLAGNPPGYQEGGIVRNTGLAYLHEGETVIPANESMGNVNIYLPNQPIILQREDQLYQLGDIISKAIDRKQRLRFGGAYSGG